MRTVGRLVIAAALVAIGLTVEAPAVVAAAPTIEAPARVYTPVPLAPARRRLRDTAASCSARVLRRSRAVGMSPTRPRFPTQNVWPYCWEGRRRKRSMVTVACLWHRCR